jgi:small subunit ribosomal protein S14
VTPQGHLQPTPTAFSSGAHFSRYMAKKSLIHKAKLKPKFSSRKVRRCFKCGRPRGFMRDFNLCRICFREQALEGNIPGIKKSSW